jgi:hypothetical protein
MQTIVNLGCFYHFKTLLLPLHIYLRDNKRKFTSIKNLNSSGYYSNIRIIYKYQFNSLYNYSKIRKICK